MVMNAEQLARALPEAPITLIEPTQRVVEEAMQKVVESMQSSRFYAETRLPPTHKTAYVVCADGQRLYQITCEGIGLSKNDVFLANPQSSGLSIAGHQRGESGEFTQLSPLGSLPKNPNNVTRESLAHLRGINPTAINVLADDLQIGTLVPATTFFPLLRGQEPWGKKPRG